LIPDKGTRIRTSDILVGPETEYRIGDKASLVGWLRELFLYGPPDFEYSQTSTKDRKDYTNAVHTLKKYAKLSKRDDIHDFEEKITARKAVTLLNKTIKEMNT